MTDWPAYDSQHETATKHLAETCPACHGEGTRWGTFTSPDGKGFEYRRVYCGHTVTSDVVALQDRLNRPV